jgi:hypothetical protein
MADAVIYNGTLPGPDSAVATVVSADDMAVHRQNAIDLYQFLVDDAKQLLQLNVDATPRTAVLGLPNSSKVRLLHCLGAGASGIGAISPTDGKLLCLTGDGDQEIGAPTPMVLPPEVLELREVICMTEAQFLTQLAEKGPTYTWPLVSRLRANEENQPKLVMQIAPIPAFLILDGFTKDVDAAELLERIFSLDNTDGEMYQHLKSYLQACLTGHNLGDPSPRISQDIVFAPPPLTARRWAKSRFARSFPTLIPAPAPPANATAPPMDIAAIIAQLLPAAQGQRAQGEEKKEEEDTPLNMSQQELATTLLMCGLPAGANLTLLPAWIRTCAEKGMTDAYRSTVLRKHIMNNYRYEDAEVPLTNTILKMAIKRNWLGKEGNVDCPSLLNASEGLSPFLLMDLTEDQVAHLNYDEDAITDASSVTPSELKALKTKTKAIVPTSSEKFLLLLQRYANLLFALFGADCPLFQCVVTVITAVKAYSRNARDKMTQITRASILWVILKQSRRFSIGEMDVIQEFKGMHEHLANKMLGFNHAETPLDLLSSTKPQDTQKRKSNNNTPAADKQSEPKKQKTNPNSWHGKLKQALEPALTAAKQPGFLQAMAYCEVNLIDIYKKFGKKCAPNCFFGKCSRGNECTRDHSLPNDKEIEYIMEATKKLRTEPTGLLQG